MSVFINIEKNFIYFIVYALIGWIYETILCSVRGKRFVNRGFLNGPYCPIYGFGAVFVVSFLKEVTNPVAVFFQSLVLTGILEYITSYLLEKLFGARWWDYSHYKYNLNGRVCLLGAVVFGTMSVILVFFIHPFVSFLVDFIPFWTLTGISVFLFAVLVSDIVVTLVGFVDFDSKLSELSAFVEQKRREFSDNLSEKRMIKGTNTVYGDFLKKMNFQQRRMISAFPKYRSTKYNHSLSELKKFIEELKEERRKK